MSLPMRIAPAPHTWWPARRRLALLALLGGALTAALVVFAGGPGRRGDFALLYVGLVSLALLMPPLVTVQVVAGQLLLASLLPWHGAAGALVVAAAMAGVVATAELLATVARLDTPMERRPTGALRRAAAAAAVGAAAWAAVALLAGVPGPSGLLAALLAAAACAALGGVLGRT
jgi:hypothetical protein